MKKYSQWAEQKTELNETVWSKRSLSYYARESKNLHKKVSKKLERAMEESSNNEDILLAMLEILDGMKSLSDQIRLSDELALSVANNGR